MKLPLLVGFFLLLTLPSWSQFVLLSEYGAETDQAPVSWAELHNPTSVPIEIVDWKIRFIEEGVEIAISSLIIPEHGYETVHFQENNVNVNREIPAFPTPITSNVALLDSEGNLISTLKWMCLPTGTSFGLSGGFPSQVHFPTPTPGEQNNANWTAFSQQTPTVSHPSGFYETATVTSTSSVAPEATLRYELGGESISANSMAWPEEGLVLNSSNINQTDLSYIPASGQYLEPSGIQDAAHTLTYQTFYGGCPVSTLERHTYFIGDKPLGNLAIPIVSISTTDDHLFAENGIYAYGITGENFAYKGRLWERPATITYFDEGLNLQLEQNVGIRIRGNSSRYSPQKSFKVYARDDYDEDTWMTNVFFPHSGVEKLKRINLRTPHTDFVSSMMTDHLAMNLVEDLSIDAPDSKTTALFLNGEFWGIYSLQESLDEYYPESHFDVNDNDVVVEEDVETGYYDELIQFATNNDLTVAENYAWMRERVDFTYLMDYFAAQLFFANWDWPQKNMKMWYSEEENVPMRYLFFDCDACFNEFDQESIERFYPQVADEPYSIIFSKLMQRESFRAAFFQRIITLMVNEFSVETLLQKLDENILTISPLVDYQIARWGFPQSREAWESNVESIRLFLLSRHFNMIEDIEKLADLKLLVYPNPTVSGSSFDILSFGLLDNDFNFEIHDNTGKSVQWGESANNHIQLDALPPGLYILRVEKEGFIVNTRFVVAD